MKLQNEYYDKLVNKATALLAWSRGYDVYGPECFVESEDGNIFDDWSGLIPEGMKLICYRPTVTGLQRWLREEHRIHVFIGYRPMSRSLILMHMI